MTALNKAFIKAYAAQPQTPPSAPKVDAPPPADATSSNADASSENSAPPQHAPAAEKAPISPSVAAAETIDRVEVAAPSPSKRMLSAHAASTIPAPHIRLGRGVEPIAKPGNSQINVNDNSSSEAVAPTAILRADTSSPEIAPKKAQRSKKTIRSSDQQPLGRPKKQRQTKAAPSAEATPSKLEKAVVKTTKPPPASAAHGKTKKSRPVEKSIARTPPPKRRSAAVEAPKPARRRGGRIPTATGAPTDAPQKSPPARKVAASPTAAPPPKISAIEKLAGPTTNPPRPKIAELLAAAERVTNETALDSITANSATRPNQKAVHRQSPANDDEPREILPFKPRPVAARDHFFATSEDADALALDDDPLVLVEVEPSPLAQSFAAAELMALSETVLAPQNDRPASASREFDLPDLSQNEPPATSPALDEPIDIAPAFGELKSGSPPPSPVGETRALSDFVTAPTVQDAFCPRLEVERFLWPTAVQSLLARIGPAIERFATELLTEAARGEKTLAITGGQRAQGRTTLTLLLAKQIGLLGGRVIVVDGDFERPLISRALGVDAPWGWDQSLSGEIPLDEAIVTAVGDRVAMLPWNTKNAAPLAPLDDVRAAACLGLLREHYDLVLVDAGPLPAPNTSSEMRRLATTARIDGCYVVHDGRASATPALAEVLAHAGGIGWRVFGVLENYSPLASDEGARQLAA
jgi:Mrp family chromosome partitioning ATPase